MSASKNVSDPLDLVPLNQFEDGYDISLLEERFCQMVSLKGDPYAVECYRAAFPSSIGYGDNQVLSHCKGLMENKKIRERIKELREQNLNATKVVKSYKINILKKVIEEALQEYSAKGVRNFSAVISAISELNKMQGDYTTQKPVNSHSGINEEDENEIKRIIEQYEKEY